MDAAACFQTFLKWSRRDSIKILSEQSLKMPKFVVFLLHKIILIRISSTKLKFRVRVKPKNSFLELAWEDKIQNNRDINFLAKNYHFLIIYHLKVFHSSEKKTKIIIFFIKEMKTNRTIFGSFKFQTRH